MCSVAIAYRPDSFFPLVIAGNRDEWRARPSASAHWWLDAPDIAGGRDLKNLGGWCAAHRDGRFALLTNIRDPNQQRPDAPSRGDLVREFLTSKRTAEEGAQAIHQDKQHYNGFNAILADLETVWFVGTRGPEPRRLVPGLYGLSNDSLDTPWPKVQRLKASLDNWIEALDRDRDPSSSDYESMSQFAVGRLWNHLVDRWRPLDQELPDTGVGLTWERRLSALFIEGEDYGTRASTLYFRASDGRAGLIEKNWDYGEQQTRLDWVIEP